MITQSNATCPAKLATHPAIASCQQEQGWGQEDILARRGNGQNHTRIPHRHNKKLVQPAKMERAERCLQAPTQQNQKVRRRSIGDWALIEQCEGRKVSAIASRSVSRESERIFWANLGPITSPGWQRKRKRRRQKMPSRLKTDLADHCG